MITQQQDATIRDAAQAVLDDFEAVIREADAPRGGMSVPFFGTFASALRLPSVMRGIRQHARQLRSALSSPPAPPEPRATELLRELVACVTEHLCMECSIRDDEEWRSAREFLAQHPESK